MKRLTTLQLVPGMTVAENVLSYDHQLILSKGTVLTDKSITKLDLYGILTIYVEDFQPKAEKEPGPASDENEDISHYERLPKSSGFRHFKQEFDFNMDSFKDIINSVAKRSLSSDVNSVLENCLKMIANDEGQFNIMDMLQNIREYDDSTFYHCINVALISHVLATWLEWSDEDIQMATACGLLHDVGKLMVPYVIITKPGKLSADEYTQVKKHPISGYQLLLSHNVDDHVRFSALMHHERCDGTGYPMHLVGDQIDSFARVVAIADVYDAMTAARVYRGPLCPFRVIEIFEAEGFQKYDEKYLLTFLNHVVDSYLKNHCRLNDGREGQIVFINKSRLSRPIVKCGSEYINLADFPDLSIEELL